MKKMLYVYLVPIVTTRIANPSFRRRKKEDRRFGPFSDLPMWHSAMVSSNANSLFADENTRESLVGFIKACDYI